MKQPHYLLDTNICIFYLRGRYDIDQFIDKVGWENCYLSEITELELKMGVELSKQRDGIDRSQRLNQFLADINVLPITCAIDLAASEKIRLRLAGTPCEDNFDLLIACTAIANGMICVTDNIKDFHRFRDIQLVNWVTRL
ncbi:MAG: PIN domain-containing protein [Prevotella sp.]|nr:PIN domain-containing protein [Prevotella sp.]MBR5061451.1 PIN domain-containing protein [Prevotella sp.]